MIEQDRFLYFVTEAGPFFFSVFPAFKKRISLQWLVTLRKFASISFLLFVFAVFNAGFDQTVK